MSALVPQIDSRRMQARSAAVYPVVLGAAVMLAPFAIDLYLPALPTIADSLQTGIDEMETTVSVFLFGFALGQVLLEVRPETPPA